MLNIFKNIQKKDNEVIIKAPLDGVVVKLEDVPDEAFAQKMIGEGVAIKPVNSILAAPVMGEIIQVFPTNHALGIKTREGLEVLLHLGIDTVDLKGQGFEAFVRDQDEVQVGDKLIKVDWGLIEGRIPSTISPIVITNMELVNKIEVLQQGEIKTGEDLLLVTITKRGYLDD